MEVSAEIIKELGYLLNDEASMVKILKYIRRLVRKNGEQVISDGHIDSFKESLAESLHEVKLHRDGKIKLQTWDEFSRELD